MGQLIDLAAARATRTARERTAPLADAGAVTTFWLDVASPFTYLAMERVQRTFDDLRWRPVLGHVVLGDDAWAGAKGAEVRAAAERRAAALRMPLVWPERPLVGARAATRVSMLAADHDRAGAFLLAAGRLAFCGGFDLDDPEVLAEAADAAGLPVDLCLSAAADSARDAEIETATQCLAAARVDGLPALQVGGRLFAGEKRLAEAVAASTPLRLPHVS